MDFTGYKPSKKRDLGLLDKFTNMFSVPYTGHINKCSDDITHYIIDFLSTHDFVVLDLVNKYFHNLLID